MKLIEKDELPCFVKMVGVCAAGALIEWFGRAREEPLGGAQGGFSAAIGFLDPGLCGAGAAVQFQVEFAVPDGQILASIEEGGALTMKLIAEGNSNKEIADLLFISVRTAESHRASIMKKLNAKKTADLVRYAIDMGYLSETTPQNLYQGSQKD